MAVPEERAGPHSSPTSVAAPFSGVRLPFFREPLAALQLATQRWPPRLAQHETQSGSRGGEEEARSPDAWALKPNRKEARQIPRLVSDAIRGMQCHVDSFHRRALQVQHWAPDAVKALGACLQAAWKQQQRDLSKLPFLGMHGLQGVQESGGLRPLGCGSALPLARIFPVFAAAAQEAAAPSPPRSVGMAPEQVARRLEGIPVFTVCNANNEFVLVSDLQGAKSLALFCFREDDAEALLAQVRGCCLSCAEHAQQALLLSRRDPFSVERSQGPKCWCVCLWLRICLLEGEGKRPIPRTRSPSGPCLPRQGGQPFMAWPVHPWSQQGTVSSMNASSCTSFAG